MTIEQQQLKLHLYNEVCGESHSVHEALSESELFHQLSALVLLLAEIVFPEQDPSQCASCIHRVLWLQYTEQNEQALGLLWPVTSILKLLL